MSNDVLKVASLKKVLDVIVCDIPTCPGMHDRGLMKDSAENHSEKMFRTLGTRVVTEL